MIAKTQDFRLFLVGPVRFVVAIEDVVLDDFEDVVINLQIKKNFPVVIIRILIIREYLVIYVIILRNPHFALFLPVGSCIISEIRRGF